VQINIVVADKSTLIPWCHDHKGRMAYRPCRNSTSGTVHRREKGRLRLRPFTIESYPPAAGRRSASLERSQL
jgi:hypothetical protein